MSSRRLSKNVSIKKVTHSGCCHSREAEYMHRALELARRGAGLVSPNPMVGAVLVKNNKIIGEGYHCAAGKDHAEIVAIKNAKAPVRGSTLYVTLEPCCHVGRTGPCVQRIVKEKIKKVVVAVLDPNPLVDGKGVAYLKKSGVEVEVGLCVKEAIRLNEIFFKNMRCHLPFVAAKTAQSLDGKTATRMGESKWITGEQARIHAKRLRDEYDAVVVGVNTVIKDDPCLNGLHKTNFKVVIDPQMRIPVLSKLVTRYSDKLIIVTSNKNIARSHNFPGILNIIYVKSNNDVLDIKDMLKKLYALGITSIFVEGGSVTVGRFFDAGVVDKIYFFIAPQIIGGDTALSSIGGLGVRQPKNAVMLKERLIEFIGEDILVTAYTK